MKVFISADIEGVTGIAHWDEARKQNADYEEFREQMTREVAAACRGALAAGATEILVKDAHATGRNLLHRELPEEVEMVRGWSGHPLCMVQELDESFAAVMMVGYHSRASGGGNPLAHTLSGRVHEMHLNGVPASEFLIHAYAASALGVPVVMVTGDANLGRHVHGIQEAVRFVAVSEGIGHSVRTRHPAVTVREIEETAREAVGGDRARALLEVPEAIELKVRYRDATDAYRAAQYPGARADGPMTVVLEPTSIREVQRALLFVS